MGNQIKTLGDIKKVAPMFGPEAVKWIDIKIEQNPDGEGGEVIADDTQIMFMLIGLSERGAAMEGKPV